MTYLSCAADSETVCDPSYTGPYTDDCICPSSPPPPPTVDKETANIAAIAGGSAAAAVSILLAGALLYLWRRQTRITLLDSAFPEVKRAEGPHQGVEETRKLVSSSPEDAPAESQETTAAATIPSDDHNTPWASQARQPTDQAAKTSGKPASTVGVTSQAGTSAEVRQEPAIGMGSSEPRKASAHVAHAVHGAKGHTALLEDEARDMFTGLG
eukprot:scaffold107713_cov39-Prasinocladus_malaysianus.AAC.1